METQTRKQQKQATPKKHVDINTRFTVETHRRITAYVKAKGLLHDQEVIRTAVNMFLDKSGF